MVDPGMPATTPGVRQQGPAVVQRSAPIPTSNNTPGGVIGPRMTNDPRMMVDPAQQGIIADAFNRGFKDVYRRR
jgi:hypothetical protein